MMLGVTMGDSSGVGPEILLKSFSQGELGYPFVCYGDLAVLEYCNQLLAYNVSLNSVESPNQAQQGKLNVIDHGLLRESDLAIGKINADSGRAAREYVVSATRAALAGDISAMVTLPMNKEATQLSDRSFVGHTELIGALCGSKDVTIMLASDQLIVTHVSTHVSLSRAIEMVRKDRICKIIELTIDAVRRVRRDPKIAVAGLNPHAGEHGLFGNEEIEQVEPAIAWAKERGMPVDGPFPPDTLFYQAVHQKKFDAVVCMYHDQGHTVLKLLDFEGGVNVALGLPIVRTSVDHGTAFDIAWKGVAGTRNLVSAMNMAAQLAGFPNRDRW
jgi:4-phospho-D-threonate 3-dehydrogenase / 4-phospho-D-erythronate 3-dehydrogenase